MFGVSYFKFTKIKVQTK